MGNDLDTQEAAQQLQDYFLELVGDDEVLEHETAWLRSTAKHGGTSEEWNRLYDIVNNYNNLRAELRAKAKERFNGK
jgi:hypothetical protein